jgi:hypothetical protein
MKTPKTSRLFTPRVNEKTGVTYYVLTERVAAYQQSFYFVNDSMTLDGRYLWFYAANPPVFTASTRMLGFVDFERDEITLCTDTLFREASPYIDPQTGEAYFTWGNRIFRRAPRRDAKAELLCTVPGRGRLDRLATHLTRSADGRELFIDAQDGACHYMLGTYHLEKGEFTLWAERDHCVNHGQINPRNSDLALYARDFHVNRESGAFEDIPGRDSVYERLWTVTRGGECTLIPPRNNFASHEWWSADGTGVYYVNPHGIQRYDIGTKEHICVHECDPWHAHADPAEEHYVFDEAVRDEWGVWYRGMPARVKFYNRKTQKEIEITDLMKAGDFSPKKQSECHIDPHPRFSENGKYVIFTTYEIGNVDLALCETELLQKLTEA